MYLFTIVLTSVHREAERGRCVPADRGLSNSRQANLLYEER